MGAEGRIQWVTVVVVVVVVGAARSASD